MSPRLLVRPTWVLAPLLALLACASADAPRGAPACSELRDAQGAVLVADAPARWCAATTEHGRVAYQDTGTPPGADPTRALVLVHGWASDGRVWAEQLPALAAEHRVLVLDLIGHRHSAKPEIEYSMDVLADSVRAAMDAAGVERGVLVGHSNGTPVVRQVYRRWPERVAGLVSVDGALRPFTQDDAMLQGFLERYRSEAYLQVLEFGGQQMLSQDLPVERRAELLGMMKAVPQHVLVSSLEAGFDDSIWIEDPIEVPLLVVRAPSPFWDESAEAFARSLAPELEYHFLGGVSHFLMLDEPERFQALVLGFVEQRALLD